MKIKDKDKSIADNNNEEEITFTKEQIDKIRKIFTDQSPSTRDERGHSDFVRLRMRPKEHDIILSAREKSPNVFRNNSELFHKLTRVGLQAYFYLKQYDPEFKKSEMLLEEINSIDRMIREEELHLEFEHRKERVRRLRLPSDKENPIIDFIEKQKQKSVKKFL